MSSPPEDPSAQYSEVKKGKKKDKDKKASPVPEVIYTEVKKDKKDKKDKKKPPAAKKPNVKNAQESKKNPQGLIYAELSDFQLKPPPKKPTKAVPPKPRYEDAPTEYASINWNASRRKAQEQPQSGSDSDVETI
ncbi:exocyst complex component 1-like [Branchiostoma floridae]|uniref:Exocyst complex component 1-like n=1 Tax=Branchiostoma floridae TaxID=7739 RepID=A0A9J7KHJ6_BRAFL|nr:exocyst complex component 1-like [Branchiostoma floridae]